MYLIRCMKKAQKNVIEGYLYQQRAARKTRPQQRVMLGNHATNV